MAKIKADEISKILREQIENYQQTVSVDEVGAIISVRTSFRKWLLPFRT